MKYLSLIAASLVASTSAMAHPGHGEGVHVHEGASAYLNGIEGLIALGLMVGYLVWRTLRSGK